MRKFIYSALAMGAAFGVAFGAQATDAVATDTSAEPAAATATASEAPASVITGENVFLNGDILTIETEANQVLVGVAKDTKKGLTVSTWDTYDMGDSTEVKVDLSKVNNTKDAYIKIKADFESDDAALVVKIPASDKLKAKYDKKNGTISVTDSKGGKLPDGAEVIYTAKGDYGTLDELKEKLSTYQMSGGIVYVSDRYVADPTVGASTDKFDIAFPARPAKDVKLTIGKLANAPKVKANYVKGEITIPKGAAFRTFTASDESVPATQAALDKATVFKVDATTSYTDKKFKGTEEFAVDVQTEAVKDKKLASKVGHYVFPAQTATDPAKIKYEDATDWSAKKVKPTLKLKNLDSKNAYTITWWAVGAAKDKPKTTKVAAGKDNVKLANVATASGIKVQRQGNAKKGEEAWAGTTVKLIDGTFTDDTAAAETPTSETAATPKFNFSGVQNITVKAGDNPITSGADVAANTVVTVTASAGYLLNNAGTALEGYTLKDADGNNVPITEVSGSRGAAFTFTMPAKSVTFATA